MLIRLKIQNLILVDFADIAFSEGLNILTGETGAGKSAILSAIRLIAGERSDQQLIGKNGEIAVVEALLTTYELPEELPPLNPEDALWIRREIHRSGRSRCFANDCQISLAELKQIIGFSIELVDQSSSHLLCLPNEQRRMLDTYINASDIAGLLEDSFAEQNRIQNRLQEMVLASETRERDLVWAEDDLAMIEETSWQPNEDEHLNQKHHFLTKSGDLIEKIGSIDHYLGSQTIKQASNLLEQCSRIDPLLASLTNQLKTASLEIDDVQRSIHSYFSKLEADPRLLLKVEERIAKIEQIKRKFGKTHEQVSQKRQELICRIEKLKHLDQEIKDLQSALSKKTEENETLAKSLRGKRRKGAEHFSKAVKEELSSLNLPHAVFTLAFEEIPLSAHGIDQIRFLFSANIGHTAIPVEECASGGELSRLLLAIKTVLVGKEKNDCLIFDEIDSNVGGQTASILGEKLKKIAQTRQVISVTHFVQVAKCAATHFGVMKEDAKGKTKTTISKLSDKERKIEYQRMLGEIHP